MTYDINTKITIMMLHFWAVRLKQDERIGTVIPKDFMKSMKHQEDGSRKHTYLPVLAYYGE